MHLQKAVDETNKQKTSIILKTTLVALKCSLNLQEYLPVLLKISAWLPVSVNIFDILSSLTLDASGGRCSRVPGYLYCPYLTCSPSLFLRANKNISSPSIFSSSLYQCVTDGESFLPKSGTKCFCPLTMGWMSVLK